MTAPYSLIEEALFAIRHAGEMPEVALHTALYDLQEDPTGPRLSLSLEEIEQMKDAVEQRYRRILMRDLNPRLRDRSIYRGLARAAANWQRLSRFCEHEGRKVAPHRKAAANLLRTFLAAETHDVAAGRKPGAVNCTVAELKGFAAALGLTPNDLPRDWERVCI